MRHLQICHLNFIQRGTMVTELSIVRLIAPNPSPLTGPGTNTFVAGDTTGCIVIDPGSADPNHLAAILNTATQMGNVQGIIITHAHLDHMGGAKELMITTGAPVLAGDKGPQGVPFAAEVVYDEDTITVGNHEFMILATPGHRFDHICLWHSLSGTLFAGDLIAEQGSIVINPDEGDMRDYIQSLERLQKLSIRNLWPSHGNLISNPHVSIAKYIEHREDRERKILLTLANSGVPRTIGQILPIVYADTDPSLHQLASQSLMAHLLKLENEGRVTRKSDESEENLWYMS
jgi:glyoxylase-like metal-dependent hydrolase (beta-lactamase superfamily II)